MAKKGSTKPSTSTAKDLVADKEKKPPSAPRNTGNEIDEIFSGKKRNTPEQQKAEKSAKDKDGKPDKMKKDTKKKKRSEGPKDSGFVDPPRPKKRMNGIAIYSEDELGIGREDAGGTPLCPFDCSCCF